LGIQSEDDLDLSGGIPEILMDQLDHMQVLKIKRYIWGESDEPDWRSAEALLNSFGDRAENVKPLMERAKAIFNDPTTDLYSPEAKQIFRDFERGLDQIVKVSPVNPEIGEPPSGRYILDELHNILDPDKHPGDKELEDILNEMEEKFGEEGVMYYMDDLYWKKDPTFAEGENPLENFINEKDPGIWDAFVDRLESIYINHVPDEE
jgi:hypothetical protein